MTSIALALALAAQQPAPPASRPLRIIDTDTVHLMARPAGYVAGGTDGLHEIGVGVTVQISAS
jgi:hypothetical protein